MTIFPPPLKGFAHLAGRPSAGGGSGRGSAGSAGWRRSAGGRPASPTPGCRSAPSRQAWPRNGAWARPWSAWPGTAWPREGHREEGGDGAGKPYEHLPERQSKQQHTACQTHPPLGKPRSQLCHSKINLFLSDVAHAF